MRDYEELVDRLRAGTYTAEELSIILPKAADAIEELSRENESLADTVNKADEIIRSRGGKWISAKEQLPEVGKRVLTLSKFGHCFDRTLREHNGGVLLFAPDGFAPGKDVTHWMPLPPPPEGES